MFKGVITPVVTILDENKCVDLQGTTKMIEFLIEGGVDGLLFLGSIGEFFAVTMAEKKALIDHVVKTVNGRVPVLIGTGGTQVDEVIELSQYAERAGATAILVVSPYYFKLDEANLYRYFEMIATSVKLPMMLYNFPERTVHDLTPALVKRLAVDFKNIVGIKDTVDNISHTRALIQAVKPVRPDFCFFTGFDEYFVPNLMAGGDGLIGGISNFYPSLFKKLYTAYTTGDMATVLDCQKAVSDLMPVYTMTQPFVAAIKMAVKLVGVPIVPEVKAPGIMANDEEAAQIRALLLNQHLIPTVTAK
jgi:4-hydroxy-tetrahydrodipicolinate synthase